MSVRAAVSCGPDGSWTVLTPPTGGSYVTGVGVLSSGECTAGTWSVLFGALPDRSLTFTGGAPARAQVAGESVTVHGRPASLYPYANTTSMLLQWSERDAGLAINSTRLTRDEVLRIADSVERVTDDEWRAGVRSAPPPSMPPDFANAPELARLTMPDGTVARLTAPSSSFVCVSAGSGSACGGGTSGLSMPARLRLIGAGGYGVIELTPPVTGEVNVRPFGGSNLPTAASGGGRYLLFAGAKTGTSYELVDAAGRVVVAVPSAGCPPASSGSSC